jgi:hypothetical protein
MHLFVHSFVSFVGYSRVSRFRELVGEFIQFGETPPCCPKPKASDPAYKPETVPSTEANRFAKSPNQQNRSGSGTEEKEGPWTNDTHN